MSGNSVFNYFLLTAVLHGFYLVVILMVSHKQKGTSMGWLVAIVVGAFSLYLFNTWIALSRFDSLNFYLSGTSIPFLYLIGPSYWLYLQFITGSKTRWQKFDVIHVVPAIVCFIAASPFYFMDCTLKLQQIAMLNNNVKDLPYQRGFYFAGHIIQTLFYLYLSFATVNTLRKSMKRQTREFRTLKDWITKTYSFMVILTLIYFISFVGFIFFREARNFFDTLFDVAIAGFIHMVGFWIIKESSILSSSNSANADKPDEGDEQLRKRIIHLMESKPFLDPGYSLKQLSDQLETNTVYASKMINTFFNKSFTELINTYRVEEVKSRLQADPDEKLLAVALESGFSNKHTFNRVFKKFAGQTPSEYRDTLKK